MPTHLSVPDHRAAAEDDRRPVGMERFLLTVLGCDGSWPGPGGAGSGYLVTAGSTRLLLDAGPGTFANLQQVCDPASLDAVVVTHAAFGPLDRSPLSRHPGALRARPHGLLLFGPGELEAHAADLVRRPVFAWQAVGDGDSIAVGELTCSFHRTDHGVETLGVRIGGFGRALGYSADSGPGWSLTDLGTGLDLALCEATYTHEHEGTTGHLSGRQAGEQARAAEVPRLVLTHRWPTVGAEAVAAEARASFGGEVEQASIGAEYVL